MFLSFNNGKSGIYSENRKFFILLPSPFGEGLGVRLFHSTPHAFWRGAGVRLSYG